MLTSTLRTYIAFVALFSAVLFLLAWFTAWINPSIQYPFWGGVKHGYFAIQNGIIGLFTGRHIWAPMHTRGYSWGFGVGVFLVPGVVKFCFDLLGEIWGGEKR
ncbi:MAG: hypothetical protein IPN74_13445 [Haliscomenobacter sp.]|nr:hypothetical protein [Haliscomenobacter sp.]MBK8879505.1 hypothetical protein [Haliscomenobacter sp.]